MQKKVRIDSFLSDNLPDVSRARLKSSIQEGLVYVNSTPQTKPAYGCKIGDVIVGLLPEPPGTTAAPEDLPLTVAYEDDHVLVVNKAAGDTWKTCRVTLPAHHPLFYCTLLIMCRFIHNKFNAVTHL